MSSWIIVLLFVVLCRIADEFGRKVFYRLYSSVWKDVQVGSCLSSRARAGNILIRRIERTVMYVSYESLYHETTYGREIDSA